MWHLQKCSVGGCVCSGGGGFCEDAILYKIFRNSCKRKSQIMDYSWYKRFTKGLEPCCSSANRWQFSLDCFVNGFVEEVAVVAGYLCGDVWFSSQIVFCLCCLFCFCYRFVFTSFCGSVSLFFRNVVRHIVSVSMVSFMFVTF